MRNQVVRRECVKLLKRFLVGPRPAEPMAIGYKLVRAGATSEDLPGIWRSVVAEIGSDDGCWPVGNSGSDEGDRLLELFTEYRTLIARADSGSRTRSRSFTARHAEDAGPLRVRI